MAENRFLTSTYVRSTRFGNEHRRVFIRFTRNFHKNFSQRVWIYTAFRLNGNDGYKGFRIQIKYFCTFFDMSIPLSAIQKSQAIIFLKVEYYKMEYYKIYTFTLDIIFDVAP